MDLVFLGAALPLTKTIAYHQGGYTVAPYPHVSKLTSFHTKAKDLKEMLALLTAHARQGHCLFNGQLTQPLVNESRQGRTKHGVKRDWVVFDFDKVDAKDAEDAIAKFLPKECQNVSCIVQLSSSMFLPNPKSFSGHVFMRLETPMTEDELLSWFEWLNFHIPSLSDSLTLTDSALALHWPLDRTAAYDSKLIYISPPKLVGYSTTLKETDYLRICSKRQPMLRVGAHTPVGRQTIADKVNALRKAKGLPEREFKTRKFEDGEVLLESEPGLIHDVRPIGDHYIKFNLNGGDSYGYWLDLRNPAIIKNFKGEPFQLTKEVDEKFYQTLVKQAGRITSMPPLEDGAEVLAFYATNQGATVTTGIFNPVARALRLDSSTQTAAAAWLAGYGIVRLGYLPHLDVVFDPESDLQFVPGHPVVNTFRATDHMLREKSREEASGVVDIPPTIRKLIQSILGDTDESILIPFMNWLAYIFQKRRKTTTSWLMHGTQGTGKGMFFHHVLVPLFGDDLVRMVQFSVAQTQFNSFMERALIVCFDEATMSAVENSADLDMKLKHWTTEPAVEIHAKGKDPYKAKSYANIVYFSNARDAVVVPEGDRRINVANRQESKIYLTPNESLTLVQHREIELFADVLKRWPINEAAVRDVIKTDATKLLHEQSTPINQLIAEAIRMGDIQFLLDRMPSDSESQADFHNRFNPIGLYKAIMDGILDGTKTALSYEDLFIIFRTLIPNPQFFQDSKTWRIRHFNSLGLIMKPQWVRELGKTDRVIKPIWQKPSEIPTELKKKPNLKVVTMDGANVVHPKAGRSPRK